MKKRWTAEEDCTLSYQVVIDTSWGKTFKEAFKTASETLQTRTISACASRFRRIHSDQSSTDMAELFK